MFVALIAAAIDALSSMFLARASALAAISKAACANPIGCVHCLCVEDSYAAASAAADCPVSDDLYGWNGLHQSSVDIPAPFFPSASTDDGKRSALPTEAIRGRKPC